MKRFEKHIFICENKRDSTNRRGCCCDKNAKSVRQKFKAGLKKLNLTTKVRANAAGCLDACEYGVTVVVYPEQVWYDNVTESDVDEIIEQHVLNDIHVERLKIKNDRFNKDE